jgi:hypothetical protein
MNVGQLRRAIAHLPDDMPVLIQTECGTSDEPNMYVIPAHIEHHTYGSRVSEDHRDPPEWIVEMEAKYNRRTENCAALLLTEWGCDKGEDITPERAQGVVDAEVIPTSLPSGLSVLQQAEEKKP